VETTALRDSRRTSGSTWRAANSGAAQDEPPQEPSVDTTIERRRRTETVESVRHILQPRSVVVIGASRNPQEVGSRILEGLRTGGFTGALYVVHAEASSIHDVRAATTTHDLPRGIDLAIVSVPGEAVLKTVNDCAQAGVHAAVVISPGFAEVGQAGRLAQDALVDLVRGYGMRLVGPNCLGVVNLEPAFQLHAACSPVLPSAGSISIASQNGSLGIAVLDLAAERELGLSSFVNVGNKADISSNDLLEYWEDDPATRVILLYLESFGNPWRFARIAGRVATRKPIVALKAGRTEAGFRSSGRHATSLGNNDAVLHAIFQQTGVISADRIDEMFDIAVCLDLQPLPRGRRVAILANTAGPGILAADACAMTGLTVAGLEHPAESALEAGAAEYRASVERALRDPGVDSLVVIYTPTETRGSAEILAGIGNTVAAARAHGISEKPVLVCAMTRKRRASPIKAGNECIPAYMFPESAIRALAKITDYAEWRVSARVNQDKS
jgi:acetate---CoA ligase (ADP-forming)